MGVSLIGRSAAIWPTRPSSLLASGSVEPLKGGQLQSGSGTRYGKRAAVIHIRVRNLHAARYARAGSHLARQRSVIATPALSRSTMGRNTHGNQQGRPGPGAGCCGRRSGSWAVVAHDPPQQPPAGAPPRHPPARHRQRTDKACTGCWSSPTPLPLMSLRPSGYRLQERRRSTSFLARESRALRRAASSPRPRRSAGPRHSPSRRLPSASLGKRNA